ncbi:MAG TPA: ATP-dependent metallopeptidase FtsH/Yme1/Tma family protein [Candidatus Sulfopaludibacter sp.]|nr:ATP-dependent metallopeptidase FtsH/Yme1/Tma family protein [Candidatus Sulfopaludibacter sp.]
MNGHPPSLFPRDGSDNEPRPPQKLTRWLSGPRQWLIWYIVIALAFYWLYREASPLALMQNIPYSEFRALVADGRLTNLVVSANEITGQILPQTNSLPAGASNAVVANAGTNQTLQSSNQFLSATYVASAPTSQLTGF